MSHVTHADLGGQTGFGPIVNEPEDERFHADWEPRVLAVTLAMGATGLWNIDMSRAARESLPRSCRDTPRIAASPSAATNTAATGMPRMRS